MRMIGVLGILVLLGIAWAMSYHPRAVKLRIVGWGLALQIVFAVIVLRRDFWSFVGMGALALLLALYMLRARDGETPSRYRLPVVLASATGLAVVLELLGSTTAGVAVLVLLIAAVVSSRFGLLPTLRAPLGVLVVASGVAWLVASGWYGQLIFASFSEKVAAFLNLSDYGARFLFGNLADPTYFFPDEGGPWPGFGFQFAFKVLPTIIFFGGFMAVLYYLGVMQRVISSIAHFMRWTVGTSGAETLSCSANIFVGQTEAPLLIKPFLGDMTRSELLTVMVGGFATIAGGVLAAYIAMGIPAAHLIAASVMAAPAALLVGKIIYPELEHSSTAGDTALPDIESGGNMIEAAANGITDGLKLAVNVAAMLVGFIALIAVLDVMLSWLDSVVDGSLLQGTWVAYNASGMSPVVGEFQGIIPGSLQTLFGFILRPVAWLMGVPWADAALVGNLIGVKLSLNELVAYSVLSTYMQDGAIAERSQVIATYALCGFANFSSIGIQIGGISAVAPGRRSDLAQLGLKAMFGGAIVSCLTATIAGMLI
jgi:CNT family concentrative nucleoside transporter